MAKTPIDQQLKRDILCLAGADRGTARGSVVFQYGRPPESRALPRHVRWHVSVAYLLSYVG